MEIEAQTFAGRMVDHASGSADVVSYDRVDRYAETLVEGARRFSDNVLHGLADAGIDPDYLALTDPDLGDPAAGHQARLLVAARIGKPRLIDNLALTLGGA